MLAGHRVRRRRRAAAPQLQQVTDAEDLVHQARAVPEDHRPAGHLDEVLPQVAVGDEEDFDVVGHALDDLLGVARGDDPVGQRLHRRRAVDVGHRLEPPAFGPELRLPARQRRGGAALGEAAAGPQVRQEHPLVGVEHLGRLAHEVDPAEDDRRRLDPRREAGQLQAVTRVVGQFLDLAVLVVVGQDRRVLAPAEGVDLVVNVGLGGRKRVQGRDSLFLKWRRNNPHGPSEAFTFSSFRVRALFAPGPNQKGVVRFVRRPVRWHARCRGAQSGTTGYRRRLLERPETSLRTSAGRSWIALESPRPG